MLSTGKQWPGVRFVRMPIRAFVIFLTIDPQLTGAREQRRRKYFLECVSPTQPAAMRAIQESADPRLKQPDGFLRTSWLRFAFTLLLSIGSLVLCERKPVDAQERKHRVLMLYPYNNLFLASVVAGEAARKRLTERAANALELYTDFLDLSRFAEQPHEVRTISYLADKYRDRKPDIVMALGAQALEFVLKGRQELGFTAPMIFCCTSRARLAGFNPPSDITGIVLEFDITKTLELAQRLQPTANHVVIVAGASDFDRQSAQIARRQLARYEQKLNVTYLVGLPHEDLLNSLKGLPRNTIVILLTVGADGTGRLFVAPDVAAEIADASSAPVYSPVQTLLQRGVVGGHVELFDVMGIELADLALEILAGADPSKFTPRPTSGSANRVDWRQLKRWNISETRLPPGSEVSFREFSTWERYRWQIITIVTILFIQAALIIWLYLERRRRLRAETNLRQRLSEVIHLNRTALTGALSASVAHELNQPLGAIQSYAEAASLYLKADPPNIGKIEEILGNIRRDDKRAADIISHLRGLLKKSDQEEWHEFDLNDAVRETLRVVRSEASKRGVQLHAYQPDASLPVRGDPVHVQQVILNLAMNGMDAMQANTPGRGRMSIETTLSDGNAIQVLVTDSGIGIPADKINQVFDPFYTTKEHGTGLGLSIARTIIETYGGKIWAENRPGGGTAFRFTLPLARVSVA
jgi:signal transduction histidine kinase